MTYNELIYMCLDELKLSSDDSYFTPEHIMFLLVKYRSFILKQRYSDLKKPIPSSNYLDMYLKLELVPAISGEPCEGSPYLRSILKIPTIMSIGNPRVYPLDFYLGEITYVSRDRMRYVGYSKYLLNIIYCSKAPNGHLYFKSSNPLFLHLESVRINAIFDDSILASDIQYSNEENPICNIKDRKFPLENSLVPPLIELVVKELRGPEFIKQDIDNNALDDLPEIQLK